MPQQRYHSVQHCSRDCALIALTVFALAFVLVPVGWIVSPSIRCYKVASTAKGEQEAFDHKHPGHVAYCD